MPRSLPLATYRLQLTSKFTFDDAAAVVPYLAELGVSHVYASPFMWARAGSAHGYDVINHAALNPDLGGEDGFARLSHALTRADLGLILDFVPNHMAVNGADNAWWLDLLEWGPASPYAPFFDIDWTRIPYRPRSGCAAPAARPALCRSARCGRDRSALRSARWQFLSLVLRSSLADRAPMLRRNPAADYGMRAIA